MAEFVTADWHLGECRFEIMDRPFISADQMVNAFAANHNALVGKSDRVYVLGDVCYQQHPEYLDRVSLFNGKKILVRGNHDRAITDAKFKKHFEHVIPEGMGIELDIGNLKCYLTHYPVKGKQDRFNLVGHIHSSWKFQLNMINVGVDVHHFKPVNLVRIPDYFKAICEYYDNDAWVAYNKLNSEYKGKRGKKSSYFP